MQTLNDSRCDLYVSCDRSKMNDGIMAIRSGYVTSAFVRSFPPVELRIVFDGNPFPLILQQSHYCINRALSWAASLEIAHESATICMHTLVDYVIDEEVLVGTMLSSRLFESSRRLCLVVSILDWFILPDDAKLKWLRFDSFHFHSNLIRGWCISSFFFLEMDNVKVKFVYISHLLLWLQCSEKGDTQERKKQHKFCILTTNDWLTLFVYFKNALFSYL